MIKTDTEHLMTFYDQNVSPVTRELVSWIEETGAEIHNSFPNPIECKSYDTQKLRGSKLTDDKLFSHKRVLRTRSIINCK